jgi:ABC-type arginine transport system permease subunit
VVGSFPAMVGLLMTGALQTISLSLMTVIVSLVFVALGAKIKRPLPAI